MECMDQQQNIESGMAAETLFQEHVKKEPAITVIMAPINVVRMHLAKNLITHLANRT